MKMLLSSGELCPLCCLSHQVVIVRIENVWKLSRTLEAAKKPQGWGSCHTCVSASDNTRKSCRDLSFLWKRLEGTERSSSPLILKDYVDFCHFSVVFPLHFHFSIFRFAGGTQIWIFYKLLFNHKVLNNCKLMLWFSKKGRLKGNQGTSYVISWVFLRILYII